MRHSVVALTSGALPEVVEPGVTGYLTHNENELGRLVLAALQLDLQKIRERVTAKFDVSVVAQSYLKLHERIVAEPN
jgi:glycosyltransferase involved in cell wall biosynthesis